MQLPSRKSARFADVTTGLDPVVHGEVLHTKAATISKRRLRMDCRVKPGNDAW
jgi:hypothetical protein